MTERSKRRPGILVRGSILVLALLAAIVLWRVNRNDTSAARPANRFAGCITAYHSGTDADGDGMDDQTDILQSALHYTETHPKYKSRYYEGGYPNDGCGVCTDLVAAALKGAGFDLRDLVDQDIRQHPDRYDVKAPDPNIDYRRVNNLRVWFQNNTISCTLDVQDIEGWQGGDIVIFRKHIGIISDRRNEQGIPYVIHHNSPHQRCYEEDILGTRKDIVGHYRIS